MAISLKKGQKINLAKEDGSQLKNLLIGLGWQEAQPEQKGFFGFLKGKVDIDIDASVLLLNKDSKYDHKNNIVYFGNKQDPSCSVIHAGDNLVGGKMAGMDDSEQIYVTLATIPQSVEKLVFVVNIYDCVARKQHFGMVRNAYIRIVDRDANQTIASYNLTDDYSGLTSLVVGEIYRHDGGWKFNAIGQGYRDSGLNELLQRYR